MVPEASMIPVLAMLFIFVAAGSAAAQSAYVGGSVLADVIRVSGGDEVGPGNGEAIGGALRVGSRLGESWGVDLEFARSGEIEWEPDVRILTTATTRFSSGVPGGIPVPEIAIFPVPEVEFRQQLSTLSTMLWWRQEVGDRVHLLYLGGASFSRTRRESRFSYGPIVLPAAVGGGIIRPAQIFDSEAVVYDAGVAVGLDAGINLTEHVRLVPGTRLFTAAPGGWVIRPSVGLHWLF
jgi:hypothetical protein